MIHVYKYAPPTNETVGTIEISSYEEWFTERECQHANYVLTKHILSNRSIQYKWQCDKCGKASNAIAHNSLTDLEKQTAAEYDTELSSVYYAELGKKYRDYVKYHTTENKGQWYESWREWYAKYRASRIWKARRSAVMHRAKGVCEACGEARPIDVHHKTYRYVGREPLFDLVAVCRECHE